eukprot:gene562-5966_t
MPPHGDELHAATDGCKQLSQLYAWLAEYYAKELDNLLQQPAPVLRDEGFGDID